MTVVKKARQSLFPLRRLKGFGMGPQILKKFYICTLESILVASWLHYCLVWQLFGLLQLQRVVCMAQYITGAKLPTIHDLYTRRCQRKAVKIVKESSHPIHRLFSLLLHGKLYRSAKSRSKMLLNIFYPPSHKTPEHLSRGCK